jgi:ankyrin repeat protein
MADQQLIDAVKSNDLNKVRTLLNNGADPNARRRDDIGMTALMYAAENRHLEVSKLLIDRGADVNAKRRWVEVSNSYNIIVYCIHNNW